MYYEESKIYFDGSHYIAIPHTTRPVKKRPKRDEEIITITQEKEVEKDLVEESAKPSVTYEETQENDAVEEKETQQIESSQEIKVVRTLTRKELFDELYLKYINLKKTERKNRIVDEMLPYFKNREICCAYVERNFERKLRNMIARRVRMCRKANLANFNYFCTFTYDDEKHTEASLKKKLKACFRNLCYRKNWKYMGVWERAPKTNRLHFHGLFNIPNGTMPGEIIKVRDYDTKGHKMQESFQSTFFNERFGRSDFKEIDEYEKRLGNALAYLMKYIEKTGEKIVYSKGLPQYFISDILDRDVVCRIGQEDRKLLLFDDFMCLDEGVLMGKVSPQVIEQMRKSN
ncbi:MAG: hypothetical protein ACI4R8_03670 [Candidatus Caccovivens sp.]